MEKQNPSAIEQMLLAELMAIQMFLLAIINSHPDKTTLLKEFDAIISNIQLHNASSGETTTPPQLREALHRFRSQIGEPNAKS